MIENLIAHVERTPPESLTELTLQDMALCQAWADNLAGRPAHAVLVKKLHAATQHWSDACTPPRSNTAGRRHQSLLRGLFEDLKRDKHQELSLEEVAFLCAVDDLLKAEKIQHLEDRVVRLLGPSIGILRQRQAQERQPLDLKTLRSRQNYAFTHDLASAPAKETRLLAGIDLPCRGPVLNFRTHLRIIGDVPDNCTVVVEGLHQCSVDGYVMGRVLSKLNCDVRQNISGVVVVLQGDVRARSIINNARAISKMGTVSCVNAQGPKLIFGGKAIMVEEGAMLGTYIGRNITVGEEVRGGIIHVAEDCVAKRFRHQGMNSLEIFLRRELVCEDFGEVTGSELKRLLSEAYRLRRNAQNAHLLAVAAVNEVEHAAQAVLMYIFGGGDAQKKLEDYLTTQKRLDIVTRIVDNMTFVLEKAQDDLSHRGGKVAEDAPETDFGEISDEDPLDEDLQQESDEVDALRDQLTTDSLDQRQTRLLLDQAREKIMRLTDEQDALRITLQQKEKNIQSLEKYEKVLASGTSSSDTKIQVLQKILPAIRKQPSDSPLVLRLRTGFVPMTLGSIERKLNHIKVYEARRAENLKDFRAVSERLGQDFQVRVLEHTESGSSAARVTGIFDSDVRIIMDEPQDETGEVAPESIVVTDGEGGVRTYVRNKSGAKFYASKR